MAIQMKKWKQLYQEYTSFEGSLFRYSLSFSLLLAIAPSLVVFAMLFNFAFLTPEVLRDVMNMLHIPVALFESVFDWFLNKEYELIPSIVTLCISFWLASRSVYSFLLISANHEEVKIPKTVIRIQSIVMFVILAILIVSVVAIASMLSHILPLIASICMIPLFTLMYRAVSFRKRAWSYGLIGAVFSTTAIMITSFLSFLLIRKFTSYSNIYGPLASLVALLLVIYIISSIFYAGYCLNIVFDDDYQKEYLLTMKHKRFYTICERIYEKLPMKWD